MELKTNLGTWDVYVDTGYYSNGRLAVSLLETDTHEPVMVATVNLPDADLAEDEVAIKNWSENEGVLRFLIDNDLVHPPHRKINTGFVQAEICKWTGI
jgi:hypothetical protein